jgi:hypothetical protein
MNGNMFEVLRPWADADPVPPKGLTASRLADLNGKKIGLFKNIKRAAGPILTVIERRLKERYPKAEFSWYSAQSMSAAQLEPQNMGKLEDWLKGVDAVIAAVAD